MYRRVLAAHEELAIAPLWVRNRRLITQRCLGWLALAAVYGGLALCLPRSLSAQDQRAILALSVNLSDQGEILVIIRAGDVLARVSDLERLCLISQNQGHD